MKIAKKVFATTLLLVSSYASAGLLVGDSVTLALNNGITLNGTVGAGDDLTLGLFRFDVNEGAQGNIFDFQANGGGLFGGSTAFTLSGLVFDDGSLLAGFNLLEEHLTNFSFSTTSTSITFNYTNPSAPAGTVIRGEYITTASAVPEPASLALLGLGLAGLGWSRRRK